MRGGKSYEKAYRLEAHEIRALEQESSGTRNNLSTVRKDLIKSHICAVGNGGKKEESRGTDTGIQYRNKGKERIEE
jgi:hypothetical protein